MTALTRAAIIAANAVVIPLRADEFSRLGVQYIIEYIERPESLHGVNVHILGGIATHVDTRSATARQLLKTIGETGVQQQRLLREHLTPDSFWIAQTDQHIDFQTAIAHYTSVAALKPRSAAAKEIENAVERIKERVSTLLPLRS